MIFPEALLDQLSSAAHVAVLTGAGISAESGVPTFREAQTGLWARYDPEQLATPEAFQNNPQLVWDWYAWRRRLVAGVVPNPAHFALAEMARRVPRLTLITQNVDGLHQRAGSMDVIELHGSIARLKCFDCNSPAAVSAIDEQAASKAVPHCTYCQGLLRPDVVWFGEMLPAEALNRAFSAARSCDLFFSIGTAALVQPAASLPSQALSQGTPTVEINPLPTPLTPAMTHVLAGPAGVLLPQLVAEAWPA